MTAGLVLALALGGAAAAGPAERATLDDGLVLWTQQDGAGRVRIAAVIRTDGEGRGTAPVLLPWMWLGGTRSLSAAEVARGLAEMGAEPSCAVAEDRAVFELRVDAARFRPAIRLFADILMYPAFDDARLKDALAAPCAELPAASSLAAALSEPGSGSPAARRPSRAGVVALHRRWLAPENMALIVDGDIGGVDVAREANAALATWNPPDVVASPAPPLTRRARAVVVHGTPPGRATVYFVVADGAEASGDVAAAAVLDFVVARSAAAALARGGGEVRGLSLKPGTAGVVRVELPEELAGAADAILAAALRDVAFGRTPAAVLTAARRDAASVLAPERSSAGAAMAYGVLDLELSGASIEKLAADLGRVGDRELRRVAARFVE